MRKLIVAVALCVMACASVQAKKLFVEMVYSRDRICLDDGSDQTYQTLKDENGKDIKFKSLAGALNYMSLQGWELQCTKSETRGSGINGISSTRTDVSYIFSKDVEDSVLREAVGKSFKK